MPLGSYQRVWIILICMSMLACLLLCFMLALAFLVLGFVTPDALSRHVVVWLHPTPMRPYLDVTTWDVLPRCRSLCAYLSPFPLHVMMGLPCLFMPLVGFLFIFTHLLTCPSMLQHNEATNITFCLLSFFFSFLVVCLLSCYACHVYHWLYALCHFHILFAFLFPLLVYWFLIFAFACLHMEQGRMELGHGLPSASKRARK